MASIAWIYTKIGTIDDPAGIADIVGSGNVEVSFQ